MLLYSHSIFFSSTLSLVHDVYWMLLSATSVGILFIFQARMVFALISTASMQPIHLCFGFSPFWPLLWGFCLHLVTMLLLLFIFYSCLGCKCSCVAISLFISPCCQLLFLRKNSTDLLLGLNRLVCLQLDVYPPRNISCRVWHIWISNH